MREDNAVSLRSHDEITLACSPEARRLSCLLPSYHITQSVSATHSNQRDSISFLLPTCATQQLSRWSITKALVRRIHLRKVSMCRVTRVRNSCGHVNDHVEMVCRDAKPESPTCPAAVLADTTNRAAQSCSPRYRDPSKLARPISPGQAARYVKPRTFHLPVLLEGPNR